MPTALSAYLARHAEAAAPALAERVTSRFQRALIIPAYAESPAFAERFLARDDARTTLLVVVVNQPEQAPPAAAQRTADLLEKLSHLTSPSLVTIAATNPPLPRRQAVGLARKLGTDLAALLHARGQLISPWLYQTDADATLPVHYFQPDSSLPHAGAIVFSHRHVSDNPALAAAAASYEAHMAHYVRGLQFARSPYAYPTLGSTLAVHVESYAAVRGFPRRDAAEDFYLLNKVAKVGGVQWLRDVVVTLQARRSQRVPFGTGPALERILGAGEVTTYNPACFALLREVQQHLETLAAAPAEASTLSAPAATLLDNLDWPEVATRFLTQHRHAPARRKAFHDWFDAFRTLKFVRAAEHMHPPLPLHQAQAELATMASSIAEGPGEA